MRLSTKATKMKYVIEYLEICKKLNDLGFDLDDATIKKLFPKQFKKFKRVRKEVIK